MAIINLRKHYYPLYTTDTFVNQRFRNIQKDIPKTLLAYVIRNFR